MKRIAWLALLAAPALAAAADNPPPAAVQAVADERAALGYAIGFGLGQRIGGDVPDLDVDAYMAGFRAGVAGQPATYTDAQMEQALAGFQQRRALEMQEQQARLARDNLAAANEFLAKNGKRKGVKTTKSGLQYEVLQKGSGPAPAASDTVKARYHGTLADGTVFDSTRERGDEPVEFPLDQVIPGWTEGLQLMNKGAKFMLYVPPALGYGAAGAGGVIAPNQALVFEVELLDFHATPAGGGEPHGHAH